MDFNISDRFHDVVVLEYDCTTESTYQFSKDFDTVDGESGMKYLYVDLKVNKTMVEKTALWKPNDDGDGGAIQFCLSSRLLTRDGNKYIIVMKKDIKVDVKVSNLISFNLNDISTSVPPIQQNNDLVLDQQGQVNAYQ